MGIRTANIILLLIYSQLFRSLHGAAIDFDWIRF